MPSPLASRSWSTVAALAAPGTMLVFGLLANAPAAHAATRTLAARSLAATATTLRTGERVRVEGIRDADALRETTAELERFEVFTPDARVVVEGPSGPREVAPPSRTYLRGTLDGDPASRLTVVLEDDGSVHGFASDVRGLAALARSGDGGLELRHVDAAPEGDHPATAGCTGSPPVPGAAATADAEEDPSLAFLAALDTPHDLAAAAAATPSHTARVAIETDYEFWQRFGSCVVSGSNTCAAQTATVAKYVGDVIAYVSTIYAGELGTSLAVPYLRLWGNSSDPWTQTSTICNLFQLGKVWNDTQSGVSRTITHMMSGKSNGGGVAWLGVLCSGAFNVSTAGSGCSFTDTSNYGGGYGYTGAMSGSFNPASPSVVWDVMAVAHEMGHNFNSPHTHCYNGIGGSSSPIDQCYGSETGCYAGTTSLPGPQGVGSGTIMSYCHLRSGSYSNITMTFGQGHPYGVQPERVPARMLAHIASRATSNPSCLAYVAPPPTTLFGDGFETGKAQWH